MKKFVFLALFFLMVNVLHAGINENSPLEPTLILSPFIITDHINNLKYYLPVTVQYATENTALKREIMINTNLIQEIIIKHLLTIPIDRDTSLSVIDHKVRDHVNLYLENGNISSLNFNEYYIFKHDVSQNTWLTFARNKKRLSIPEVEKLVHHTICTNEKHYLLGWFKIKTADSQESSNPVQISISLTYQETNDSVSTELLYKKVQIRNNILNILSSKNKDDLDNLLKKVRLNQEIYDMVNNTLIESRINSVEFNAYILDRSELEVDLEKEAKAKELEKESILSDKADIPTEYEESEITEETLLNEADVSD